VVGGIGMALHEETATDHRFGRFMAIALATITCWLTRVHGIAVIFVDEHDDEINPLGATGVG
jgi:xanthine dehydrogenase YagR molybdenum-binding subunit